MTPDFYNRLVLFIVVFSFGCTLSRVCGSINQKSAVNLPPAGFGDLLLLKKENDRFPNAPRRQTLGNDIVMKKGGHSELVSESTSWVVH